MSVSSGNGDRDYIKEKVQEWLDHLAQAALVIKDIEKRIKDQNDFINLMRPKYNSCMDALNDIGLQISAFLDDNRDVDWWELTLRVGLEVLDEILERVFKKLRWNLIKTVVGASFYASDILDHATIAFCAALTSNLFTAQRDIENLEEVKQKVEEKRGDLIEAIRQECECALPEKYGKES